MHQNRPFQYAPGIKKPLSHYPSERIRSESPNLASDSTLGVSSMSKELQRKLQKLENKWNQNFNVTASKNNETLHTDYKEYFDRPLAYTINGQTHSTLPRPMMIYENKDGSPATSKIMVNRKKLKELQKRASTERHKTSRVNLRKHLQMVNPHKNTEYGFNSNNQMFSTFLRLSNDVKSDKQIVKMEKKWNDRFVVPFS